MSWVSGMFQDGNSYSLFQNDLSKYKELLEALRQDISEASAEDFLEMPCARLNFQYENVPGPEKKALPGLDPSNYYYADIFVYPAFGRTMELLKETGYPLSMEDIPIVSVNVNYYSEDRDVYAVEYSDEKEINEIKKVLIPSNLIPSWEDVDYSVEISYIMEREDSMGYGYIRNRDIPKLMEEDRKAYEDSGKA